MVICAATATRCHDPPLALRGGLVEGSSGMSSQQRQEPAQPKRGAVERNQAWLGDAVLALYARLRILREDGTLDGSKAIRMSSNRFLAAIGEPTSVEAAIGRVFERDGLDAAFAHIEGVIMPVFVKQEEKRRRKAGPVPRGA